MITVDTNILVSAYLAAAPQHRESRELVEALGNGPRPFALLWPCLYGFVRITTHHRIYSPALPMEKALADVKELLSLPSARVLSETDRHAEVFRQVLQGSGAAGNLVHDAHLVALAVEHGVDEILTFDGDFARFPQVRSRHPFRYPA